MFRHILFLSFLLTIIFCGDPSKMTPMEIVNDMGMGWNLANTFDSRGTWKKIEKPEDQITMWGNVVPTEKLITSLKKYGFKTIRFPVTWENFIDEKGNVADEWMDKVKETVDWMIEADMYVILNTMHDQWLLDGLKVKDRFMTLWTNIAKAFKNYDKHLIFEELNEPSFKNENGTDFHSHNVINQLFVDTVRKTGGNNADRLLLISTPDTNMKKACDEQFEMPDDPAEMLAISVHYYEPTVFAIEDPEDPWKWTDDQGKEHIVEPRSTWGTEADYKEMIHNFEIMKEHYADKGIPVIIGETGVLTGGEKDEKSVKDYLYSVFSFTQDYDGFMVCLWDTSTANIKFYNRVNDTWYDEEILDMFRSIQKGDYVKPSKYLITINNITSDALDEKGFLDIKINERSVTKVIFNANISDPSDMNCGFGIGYANITGKWNGQSVGCSSGKKQKDGTYTYTVDLTDVDAHDYIQVQEWWGNDNISINYATVVFEKKEKTLDYNAYKKALKTK